jgi:hypothetical protein
MAGTTGIGTTFSLPNFHGELLALTPADTPFLTAIGGLSGGKQTTSTAFEWQTSDLRDPAQPSVLEGATAPTAQARVRANVTNVCQIHQETVAVSYTKLAATGQYSTPSAAPYRTPGGTPNPVTDELDFQTMQALKTIALDVNFSFINGHINVPTTNAGARRTKGLIEAIETNVTNKGTALTGATTATDTITVTHALDNGDKVIFTDTGDATNVVAGRVYYVVSKSTTVSFKVAATLGGSAITLGSATVDLVEPWATTLDIGHIDTFVQGVYDNGGLNGETATFLVSSSQKRALTAAYATAYGKALPFAGTRNIGGVSVDTVLTDFGTFNVLLDRHVPKDAIIACSLDQLAPVFLSIPGKGVFFEEPLAKTGASEQVQLYGEIGLEFGSEKAHGILRGLAV